MKRYVFLVVAALVTALSSFELTRWLHHANPGDEMAWLREEFALTPEQAVTIGKLHAAYEPICADHCERIADAHERLMSLAKSGQTTGPAYDAAKAQWESLRHECSEATRRHLEAVAAAMSPEQGRRYLEMIGPKIAQHLHDRPLGLQ